MANLDPDRTNRLILLDIVDRLNGRCIELFTSIQVMSLIANDKTKPALLRLEEEQSVWAEDLRQLKEAIEALGSGKKD